MLRYLQWRATADSAMRPEASASLDPPHSRNSKACVTHPAYIHKERARAKRGDTWLSSYQPCRPNRPRHTRSCSVALKSQTDTYEKTVTVSTRTEMSRTVTRSISQPQSAPTRRYFSLHLRRGKSAMWNGQLRTSSRFWRVQGAPRRQPRTTIGFACCRIRSTSWRTGRRLGDERC